MIEEIPISLYPAIDNPESMSWMKDDSFDEKDKKKLESGSGIEKAITIFCRWLYSVVSW